MPAAMLRTIIITFVVCGIAGAMLYHLQSPRTAPSRPGADQATSSTPIHIARQRDLHAAEAEITRTLASLPMPEMTSTPRPARPGARLAPAAQQLATDTIEGLDLNDPALRLPLARLALSAVGMDELAEQLWLSAINDPEMDPEARKDLIEDLNEDGFADPKNLTRDDLPLIEARLALIDRHAPDAMDATNTEAFAEARKDLVAMRERLVPAVVDPVPMAQP